ncbi:hypothetical protein AAII07_35735 [Microvirga sp. 0TCS3.31]
MMTTRRETYESPYVQDIWSTYGVKPSRKRRYKPDDFDATLPSIPKAKREKKKVVVPSNFEQYELLIAAWEKAGERRPIEKCRPYSKQQANLLYAMNPWAGDRWAGYLHEAIEEADAEETLWFVTIVSDDFVIPNYFAIEPTADDLKRMLKRMRLATSPQLRPHPFLLQADVALRREIHDFRKVVEAHYHGYLWATRSQISRLTERFGTTVIGAPSFKAKKVYDLPGAFSYSSKDGRLGYSTWRTTDRKQEWIHGREPLSPTTRRLLTDLFNDLTKPELCISSGLGTQVLRRAKQLATTYGYRKPWRGKNEG